MSAVRIVVILNLADASPRELRERFAEALRDAIHRARQTGRIDRGQAEEMLRALPARGHA